MPIIQLPTLHKAQAKIWRKRKKRNLVRTGRRFGKTKMMVFLAGNAASQGRKVGIFTPTHRQWLEPYSELTNILHPMERAFNKSEGSVRLQGGGVIDFWHLTDNELAGRGREYDVLLFDEAGFTKNTQTRDIWDKSIVSTTATKPNAVSWVFSTPNGVNPDNFFYQCAHDPMLGFTEFHAPSSANKLVSKKWIEIERGRLNPLVFRQEIEAEFVDWSGVAFFGLDRMLDNNMQAVPWPDKCDGVFAVIDSALKTGTGNDGTSVVYYARNLYAGQPLTVLDWDIVQIEGALLDTWLNGVMQNLEMMARSCGARSGINGVWVEDKASGIVLLQQAKRRGMPVHPIAGKWMQLGKDERALSVSGYHYQGLCKISARAHDKTVTYKGTTRNHFEMQVTGFRLADNESARRADDLLDAYVHGLALAFGNKDQF